jgi:hypothetical protein
MRTAVLLVLVLCVVGTWYQNGSAASPKRRVSSKIPQRAVGDAVADAIVDAALEETSAAIQEAGLDPTELSETILELTIDGNISGLSNVVRGGEATYDTSRQGTTLNFDIQLEQVTAVVTITTETDPTVAGQGAAEVEIENIQVSADQQDDGTYLLTSYSIQPLSVDIVFWDLGDIASLEDDLRALLGELITENVVGVIEEGIIVELAYVLATGVNVTSTA